LKSKPKLINVKKPIKVHPVPKVSKFSVGAAATPTPVMGLDPWSDIKDKTRQLITLKDKDSGGKTITLMCGQYPGIDHLDMYSENPSHIEIPDRIKVKLFKD
jgi:hypothetical protein